LLVLSVVGAFVLAVSVADALHKSPSEPRSDWARFSFHPYLGGPATNATVAARVAPAPSTTFAWAHFSFHPYLGGQAGKPIIPKPAPRKRHHGGGSGTLQQVLVLRLKPPAKSTTTTVPVRTSTSVATKGSVETPSTEPAAAAGAEAGAHNGAAAQTTTGPLAFTGSEVFAALLGLAVLGLGLMLWVASRRKARREASVHR
jgi:hypothetical protein